MIKLARKLSREKPSVKPKFTDLTEVQPSEVDIRYMKEIEQYTYGMPLEAIVASHINDDNMDVISNNLDEEQPIDLIVPGEDEDENESSTEKRKADMAQIEACTYLYKDRPEEERVLHKNPVKVSAHTPKPVKAVQTAVKSSRRKPPGAIMKWRYKMSKKTYPGMVFQIQKHLSDPFAKKHGNLFKLKMWIYYQIYRRVYIKLPLNPVEYHRLNEIMALYEEFSQPRL